MSWSSRRQASIALSILLVLVLAGVGAYFAFFYKAPSCFDGVLNGAETGIDCGGSCQKICPNEAQAPVVLWSRAVPVTKNVYNAVALVKNPNPGARALHLQYSFSLYDDKNLLIAQRRGETYLNPGETAPIFEPSVIVGERPPSRSFFQVTGVPVWEHADPSPHVLISGETLESVASAPRATAAARNDGFSDISNITLVALVYDASDNVIAASQTVIPALAAKAERQVAFTWPSPFAADPARIEITPRIAPSPGNQ